MKLLNKYTFYARYLPGLITLLPASLMYFFITNENTQYELTEYFLSLPFFCGISATFIITYVISMVTRELGAIIESKYFHSRSGFPTTYNMLWSNNKLSKQDKRHYADKLKEDFNIDLLSEDEENNNPEEALKLLNRASRLLSTKYQQHIQVQEANIAYGFSRNVCGGSLIAFPLAIIGIIIGLKLDIQPLIFWSSCLSIFYLLVIVFHKAWIIRNADRYADKLFAVYFNGAW